MIQRNPSTLIVPGVAQLTAMIAAAERKCDGDVDQTRRRIEARAEAKMARHMLAETEARARLARWGHTDQ